MPKTSELPIKILLVEDQLLIRVGLKTLLEREEDITVIGEAANGQQAIELATQRQPHVILMDIGMPVMDGIAATRIIRDRHPQIRIIMVTSNDNEQEILASFAAGASGYYLKDLHPERLFSAIRSVHAGDVWLHASIASKLLKDNALPVSVYSKFKFMNAPFKAIRAQAGSKEQFRLYEPLSPRENEVLSLIVEGLHNPQIAKRLQVSPATAKTHVRNILNKLAVEDRTKAAIVAVRNGLLN